MKGTMMSEPIHMRVKRILSGKIEDAIDAMERSGGPSVMREAVRDVERAIDDVRSAQAQAGGQRLQAIKQQAMAVEHVEKLTEKAKFALEQGREDLAEAALTRQIDFEGQIPKLKETEEAAREEETRLEGFAIELISRKAEMEQSLKAYEMAHREGAKAANIADKQDAKIERTVGRAEAAFDRAMSGAGGVGFTKSEAGTITKVAEIDALQRQSEIAQRMAALRTG
jgi:phage shock protein A